MLKNFKVVMGGSLLIVISFCIIVNANNMKLKIFKNSSGKNINLYYTDNSSPSFIQNKNSVGINDKDNVEVGDIIYNNDIKEIVVAISDDGTYITLPYEDIN